MASIDLVPNDYRLWLGQRRMLRNYGFSLILLTLILAGAAMAVGNQVEDTQALAAELRVKNTITQKQQQQLADMKSQQAEYERQWSLLRGLRAGAQWVGLGS